MEPYRDWDNDSGVRAFEISEGQIDIQFKTGAVYRYTSSSVGSINFNQLVDLARAGEGLNSFINRVVRKLYSARLR
ncbi:hypothetical protein D2V17_20230 [Aurantiacibacter xanthus]|uniref:KTSC domain-containing protein n=1 Tax=Aurantiacibacter xanthus TaxID=1784712 RepID=A0A3A1P3B2_9SPHN|nr:hypothetical protein D2V17_20230 [Aurantiacibacter xanthus]